MAYRILFTALAVLMLQACAKIGKPTGGPRDVYPPEYISGEPENRSTNFTGDQIDIYFNEYIQLKDQNKEVLFSPPLNERPVIRVREKSIRVSLDEDLLPQTTYTINFGKSLVDLNESNALPDFEFVFSTGDVIDSLSVTGKVLDAFSRKPETETPLLVMLYENLADSAPLLEIPRYYGRTNENGLFSVNNLHADTFRIIALQDANNNMKYDAGIENIAFADSFLVINAGNVMPETFIKDTVKIITAVEKAVKTNRKDTATIADTIIAPGKLLYSVHVSLFSFLEENTRVFLDSRERVDPERIQFIFNRPLYDSLIIEPINFRPDSSWYLLEASPGNDTLTYWISDTLIAKMDTMQISISYLTPDSTGNLSTRTDTIRLRKPLPTAKGGRGAGRRREVVETGIKESVILSGNVSNRGKLNLNSSLLFTIPRPLRSVNPDSIELLMLSDTVFRKVPLIFSADTSSMRRFRLSARWEEGTQYKVFFKPGAVYDLFGITNDSTEINFSTQEESFYGNILLNFSSIRYPVIVQVINEKGSVINSAIARQPGILTFNYVLPGRYSFKAVQDDNKNGKWDTGNYLKGIQPEKVYVSGKAEQLRSNWDWEPTWTITGD